MKKKNLFNFTVFVTMIILILSVLPVRADVNDQPIIIKGSQLASLNTIPPDQIHVLKYNATTSSWGSLPYQVDERFWIDLATCYNDPGSGNVDSHLTYDFNNTEGNGLDADDEVLFLVRDCSGDAAPVDSWPGNVGDTRYEVMVHDAGSTPLGHCYIFSAITPPVEPSPINYVNYTSEIIDSVLENTTIETDTYIGHYSARWRFDRLSVQGPGGSGQNIIDRFKHRAYVQPDGTGSETEETWDLLSCFITRDSGPISDHKVGAVRAVREVQGAASGVNTTYTDYFYSSFFQKRVNLRLHPMGTGFLSYIDYHRQVSPATFYNPGNPLGVPVDGAVDSGINMTLYDWEMVVNDTDGGLFWHRNEPIPVPAQQRRMFYWDDANFADQTGDDEPGRYGAHGIWWSQVADTDTPGSEAIIDSTFIPLAASTGNIGQSLADEIENPPSATVLQQDRPIDCGNGICGPGENSCNCPADCGPPPANEDPALTCGDLIDNDCDGLADCDDSDCASACEPYCGDETCDPDEDSCSCSTDCGAPPASEDPATTCNDGLDNDCDMLTDGADPDCSVSSCAGLSRKDCRANPQCSWNGKNKVCEDAPACTVTEDPEVSCSDGIDNDCDDLTDGEDPDCSTGGSCNNNGICDNGEDCLNCDSDCAGKTSGKPANRYCCGNGIQETAEGDGSICDGNY